MKYNINTSTNYRQVFLKCSMFMYLGVPPFGMGQIVLDISCFFFLQHIGKLLHVIYDIVVFVVDILKFRFITVHMNDQ